MFPITRSMERWGCPTHGSSLIVTAPQNPGGIFDRQKYRVGRKGPRFLVIGESSLMALKCSSTEVVNLTDNFDSDAMLSRSSVHVLLTYSD